MRITIAAIGKAKSGPERALYDEYIRRLPWKVALRELEAKKDLPALKRKTQEAALLSEAAAGAQRLVALDERGKTLSSREFAQTLSAWQGAGSAVFVIGGADGLDEALVSRADLVLSFGRMSWPHMLARAMLAEQLYRAQTLIAGHPYHRD